MKFQVFLSKYREFCAAVQGLFEIGFRFVVPAGETGSDFKYGLMCGGP
jgi:hypothetical protein